MSNNGGPAFPAEWTNTVIRTGLRRMALSSPPEKLYNYMACHSGIGSRDKPCKG